MRILVGCSGAIALVAFVVGGAASMLVRNISWTERLIIATTPAAIAFVAALLLFSRDRARHSAILCSVRNRLLAEADVTDDGFVSLRPIRCHRGILLETRKAISRFFDVPAGKINRDVRLIRDLHVDKLGPAFHCFVVDSVMASKQIAPKPFRFSTDGHETIDDLAVAIQNVLEGFDHR